MKILVVAAHPDDETLGMGGTLAKLARAKHDIEYLWMTDGVSSRANKDLFAAQQKRRDDALKAVFSLSGKGEGSFIFAPDNAMDSTPLLGIVRLIAEKIDQYHPDVVYTNSITDLNIDHRRTAEAVLVATRPVPGTPGAWVKAVYSFEVPSSTEWAFGQLGTFRPTVFECLGGVDWEAKEKALDCYADELRSHPHPRSKEVLKAVAQVRGGMVGVGLAEAFEVIRDVRG